MRKSQIKSSRRTLNLEQYDRVLIVCEGTKTEPLYFKEIRQYYELKSTNIKIVGEGADPLTIVHKAIKLSKAESKHEELYDKVYCVFDQDEHTNFEDASIMAKHRNFELCRSWPCFEFWFLLHFCYTRQPIERKGNIAPATNCINLLRAQWPEYSKNDNNTYQHLKDRVEDAKENAKKALVDVDNTGSRNPSTEVHELVSYLENLKGS